MTVARSSHAEMLAEDGRLSQSRITIIIPTTGGGRVNAASGECLCGLTRPTAVRHQPKLRACSERARAGFSLHSPPSSQHPTRLFLTFRLSSPTLHACCHCFFLLIIRICSPHPPAARRVDLHRSRGPTRIVVQVPRFDQRGSGTGCAQVEPPAEQVPLDL